MAAPRTHIPPAHLIDRSEIAEYCQLVFGYLEGWVPVRAFSEKGTRQKTPVSEFHDPTRVADAIEHLAHRAAEDGRGLYVVPATVARPGSARTDDVIQTGVVVADIDDGDVDAICHHLSSHLGPPSLDIASGGRTDEGEPKRHLYWRLTEAAAGDDLERVRKLRETIAKKVGGDLSFARLHQPIRVPGSVHGKNGRKSPVRILKRTPREHELDELELLVEEMPPLSGTPGTGSPANKATPTSITAADLMDKVVRENCADGISRFAALSRIMGHHIRRHRLGSCSIEEAWSEVSNHNALRISPPWPEERLRREFAALVKRDVSNHGSLPSHDQAEKSATDAVPAPRSEDAIACEFVHRHGRDHRHVARWGAWYAWDGHRWINDEVGSTRDLMRSVCRDVARTAEKPAEARRISSEKTIAAALRIAACDAVAATRTDDWDNHPWLLNTPGGVLDLRSGEMTSHDPDLLMTQMTSATPDGDCPRWMTFLDEVTDNDQEVQGYLQRLAGYCLTGSTSEQMFAFFHGPGANGKSVLIRTIATILGDYAVTATAETFLSSRNDRHLTELAGLRAARLVAVPEIDKGRAWAEGRIKSVTGGEKIRANYMRQDHFEFEPQFKLLVAGNHRPSLDSAGEAMRRRLHLVPFEVTIPDSKRDGNLCQKLLQEADGILAWMVQGCADWQRVGLAPPTSIRNAAAAYFDDEDLLGQWLEECCDVGHGRRSTAQSLYRCWAAWCEQGGHQSGSQKSLGSALREHGFATAKVHGQRGWLGLDVRTRKRSEGHSS